MSTNAPDPRLGGLEQALAALRPAADGLDRDNLLFRAGQASTRRPRWPWPAAAAAANLLAVGLGVVLLVRPGPPTVERVVVLREPASTPSEPPSFATSRPEGGGTGYLLLREQVLEHGVESLPPPLPVQGGESALSARSLLDL
jgi:hypothetical protein